MSRSTPHFVATKDYVPEALLPIVVHTKEVPSMPPHVDCRSECHPPDGYLHPGGFHYLRRIHRYDQFLIERAVTQFNESIAQTQLVRNQKGAGSLTIHVDGIVEEIPAGLPDNVEEALLRLQQLRSDGDLSNRTDTTILNTATTIYHQLFPSVAPNATFRRHPEWGLKPQYMIPFIFADWTETESFTNSKMAVFVVPPWYLAPRDMRDFVNIRAFKGTDFIRPGTEPDMEQKRQHYWALVNDFCYMHQVQHFAFTTYEEWVFGCFSDDFADVCVSEVRGYTSRWPTILETFLFWMHSACGHDPGVKPSQVGYCPPFQGHLSTDEAPCTYEDLFDDDPEVVHAVFSCH
ncbi:hypothetical protein PLICRDRAFT_56813 [Plicaturopsis crispa FD-325 SS-3]|nr:hypothetical protein PLICRDRAFT_56813 [Plicaturopsis crispa FD-325 SS-3]